MRKKSKYKPRAVLLNPLGYVLEGLTPVAKHDNFLIDMKIKNHGAMMSLTQGRATRPDMDLLVAMGNIVEALFRLGFGREYNNEVREGLDAIHDVCVRGAQTDKFILKPTEMNALNTLMELHDAQMEVITVKDMDKAVDLVREEQRQRKMRTILKKENEYARST